MRSLHRPAGALTALAGSIALVAAACGSAGPSPVAPSAGTAGLTTRFENVTFARDVTVIEPAALAPAIRAAEPTDDGLTLHLDPSGSGVGALAAGQTVLLGPAGPRHIESVDRAGADVVVRTTPAPLGEIIDSGTLGWTYAVDWASLPATAWAGAGGSGMALASVGDLSPQVLRELAAVKGDELRFTGKVKGFDVELKFVPRSDKLDFEFSAARSNVKVAAKGFISDFVQETRLEYDGGEATLIETTDRGLKGEATIEWSAFQTGNEASEDDVVGLDIPLELPIPFTVGPVPMTMKIKAVARIVPAFNGEASSGGSFKLTYDAEHGFTSNGADVTPAAKIVKFVADLGDKETVTASTLPAGFAFGFEFPRLELSLGNPFLGTGLETYAFLTLYQYANGQFTPGTTLSADIPPCQRASLQVKGIAGYKLSVLGFAELSDNKLLWEKQVDKYLHDKPCTLTGK